MAKPLYRIVQTKDGKETVKMVDSLPKCNNRIKELRSSYRGKNWIKFRLEKAEGEEKFEDKPISGGYQSGDYGLTPRVIKR